MELIRCQHCGIEKSKNGIGTHIWREHGAGKNHNPYSNKEGRKKKFVPSTRKGLTKENCESIKRVSEKLSQTIKKKIKEGKFIPNKMGEEARKKLSIEQTLNNRGGKCKWFNVGGQKVQGSWERDLATKMSELKIKWNKPKVNSDIFEYKDEKIKRYTPDFYLEELSMYLEVKGFWWGNDKKKMRLVLEQNQINLCIIEKELFELLLNVKTKEEYFGAVTKMVKVTV